MRKVMVASAILMAAGGASAQLNKCTGPDGKVTYSDAPCSTSAKKADSVKVWDSNLSGRSQAGSWEFRRSKDDMTGQLSCMVISPVTSPDPKGRDFKFLPAHLVIVVTPEKDVFGVRTSTDKDLFHNDLSGMGVKLDNAAFTPLDIKGGQHVVCSTQGPKILEALPKAKSIRLRLRFWPYDTLYDTLPINAAGFNSAHNQAKQCAGVAPKVAGSVSQ